MVCPCSWFSSPRTFSNMTTGGRAAATSLTTCMNNPPVRSFSKPSRMPWLAKDWQGKPPAMMVGARAAMTDEGIRVTSSIRLQCAKFCA